MFDARRLLDALVAGAAKARGEGASGRAQGQSSLATLLDELVGTTGQGRHGEDYVRKAKDFITRHPGLAEAALMSVAGMLMGSRKRGGIAAGAARLGGLALIATLAYKAYQNYQAGKPLLVAGGGTPRPGHEAFDPAAASDDDALRFARAMVAAASADGRVDENERARIAQGMAQAGIDAQATRWLEDELASPATVEDLAEGVQTPEKAAQVYAAARLAINPDTIQEREFLRQLAESLDLDPQLAKQIDDAAAAVRL